MANIIGIQDFSVKVAKALGLEPDRVARIIIDLDAANSGPLLVYVTLVGNERLLELQLPDVQDCKIIVAGAEKEKP